MTLVHTEQILVVPTELFRRLGYFQGFSADVDKVPHGLLNAGHTSYRPRSEMETDPSFKQLIPYVIFASWTRPASRTCSNTLVAKGRAKNGCTANAASASAVAFRSTTRTSTAAKSHCSPAATARDSSPHIIHMIEAGQIDTAPWITHRLNLSAVPTEFPHLRQQPKLVKAMIEVAS